MSTRPAETLSERMDRLGAWLLLPLLGTSTLLAWLSMQLTGYGTPDRFYYGLIVVGITAAWCVTMSMPARRIRRRRLAVACAGHLALCAVLVGVNPWFALFAWTGYMMTDDLPFRWAKLGLITTAMISAAGQIGGYPTDDATHWGAWLLVGAVNAVLVFVLVDVSNRVMRQNAERGEMITELHETNARLEQAVSENAGLHAQLVEQAREAGVHDERQRLAGEIHDTLAQGLTGIVTQLEAADQARHLPDVWQRHLDLARRLARQSLVEARRSVRALRPEQLERASLGHALDEHARGWTQTSGVPVRIETTGSVRPLPDDVEVVLFRVAQEALTNIGKHARAAKVWLTLTYLDDVVLLDVRDDGVGWAPGACAGGYGLDGMRQRLARVGGTLEIETAPGEGTALSAAIGHEQDRT